MVKHTCLKNDPGIVDWDKMLKNCQYQGPTYYLLPIKEFIIFLIPYYILFLTLQTELTLLSPEPPRPARQLANSTSL